MEYTPQKSQEREIPALEVDPERLQQPGGNGAQVQQAAPDEPDPGILGAALAEELTGSMSGSLKRELIGKVFDDKSVKDMRSSKTVNDKALAGAKSGREQSGTAEQQRDLEQHEGQHASKGVDKAVRMQVDSLVNDAMDRIQESIKASFVQTAGSPAEEGFEKRLKQAQKAAKQVSEEQYKLEKKDLSTKMAESEQAVAGLAEINAIEEASAEIEARVRGDTGVSTAVDAADINSHVRVVEGKVKSYLEDKIGANPIPFLRRHGPFKRSDEVMGFRNRMKGAARDKAKEQVHEHMQTKQAGPATKRFVAMDAERETYDPAKASAETAIRSIASDGTEASLTYVDAADLFKAAASAAAWDVLQGDGGQDKANKKASKAASSAEKAVETKAKDFAHKWKDLLLGKPIEQDEEQLPQDAVQPPSQEAAETTVKDQVVADQVGQKAVNGSFQAHSSADAMGWVASLIDKAVPQTGDHMSLSVEVQIPIPTAPGVFILIGISGTARRGDGGAMMPGARNHRGDDSVEVQFEFKFGAGVEFVGLKADASLAFFLRSGAESAGKCTKALSYGVYRAVSRRSEKLARIWAGTAEGTDKDVNERSEAWAGMMEEQVFLDNPDAYAEIGAAVQGGVSMNLSDPMGSSIGGVSGSASARGELRNHIDRDSIMSSLGIGHDEGAQDQDAAKKAAFEQHLRHDENFEGVKAKERRQSGTGEWRGGLVISGSFTVDVAGQAVTFAGSLGIGNGSWEGELSATITMTMGDASAIEKLVAGTIRGSASAAKKFVGMAKSAKKGQKGRGASDGVAMVDDFAQIFNAESGDEIGTKIAESYQVDESISDLNVGQQADEVGKTSGLSQELSLKVAVFFGSAQGMMGKPKGGIEISEVTSRSVNVSVAGAGLNIGYQKGSTLLQAGHDGDQAFIEFLGMSSKGGV